MDGIDLVSREKQTENGSNEDNNKTRNMTEEVVNNAKKLNCGSQSNQHSRSQKSSHSPSAQPSTRILPPKQYPFAELLVNATQNMSNAPYPPQQSPSHNYNLHNPYQQPGLPSLQQGYHHRFQTPSHHQNSPFHPQLPPQHQNSSVQQQLPSPNQNFTVHQHSPSQQQNSSVHRPLPSQNKNSAVPQQLLSQDQNFFMNEQLPTQHQNFAKHQQPLQNQNSSVHRQLPSWHQNFAVDQHLLSLHQNSSVHRQLPPQYQNFAVHQQPSQQQNSLVHRQLPSQHQNSSVHQQLPLQHHNYNRHWQPLLQHQNSALHQQSSSQHRNSPINQQPPSQQQHPLMCQPSPFAVSRLKNPKNLQQQQQRPSLAENAISQQKMHSHTQSKQIQHLPLPPPPPLKRCLCQRVPHQQQHFQHASCCPPLQPCIQPPSLQHESSSSHNLQHPIRSPHQVHHAIQNHGTPLPYASPYPQHQLQNIQQPSLPLHPSPAHLQAAQERHVSQQKNYEMHRALHNNHFFQMQQQFLNSSSLPQQQPINFSQTWESHVPSNPHHQNTSYSAIQSDKNLHMTDENYFNLQTEASGYLKENQSQPSKQGPKWYLLPDEDPQSHEGQLESTDQNSSSLEGTTPEKDCEDLNLTLFQNTAALPLSLSQQQNSFDQNENNVCDLGGMTSDESMNVIPIIAPVKNKRGNSSYPSDMTSDICKDNSQGNLTQSSQGFKVPEPLNPNTISVKSMNCPPPLILTPPLTPPIVNSSKSAVNGCNTYSESLSNEAEAESDVSISPEVILNSQQENYDTTNNINVNSLPSVKGSAVPTLSEISLEKVKKSTPVSRIGPDLQSQSCVNVSDGPRPAFANIDNLQVTVSSIACVHPIMCLTNFQNCPLMSENVSTTKQKADSVHTNVVKESNRHKSSELVKTKVNHTKNMNQQTPSDKILPIKRKYKPKIANTEFINFPEGKKVYCYTCKSKVCGNDILLHLYFGALKCANCEYKIEKCYELNAMDSDKFLCGKRKSKTHNFCEWDIHPVDYIHYKILHRCFKNSPTTPSATEILLGFANYIQTMSLLKTVKPWSSAVIRCMRYSSSQLSESPVCSIGGNGDSDSEVNDTQSEISKLVSDVDSEGRVTKTPNSLSESQRKNRQNKPSNKQKENAIAKVNYNSESKSYETLSDSRPSITENLNEGLNVISLCKSTILQESRTPINVLQTQKNNNIDNVNEIQYTARCGVISQSGSGQKRNLDAILATKVSPLTSTVQQLQPFKKLKHHDNVISGVISEYNYETNYEEEELSVTQQELFGLHELESNLEPEYVLEAACTMDLLDKFMEYVEVSVKNNDQIIQNQSITKKNKLSNITEVYHNSENIEQPNVNQLNSEHVNEELFETVNELSDLSKKSHASEVRKSTVNQHLLLEKSILQNNSEEILNQRNVPDSRNESCHFLRMGTFREAAPLVPLEENHLIIKLTTDKKMGDVDAQQKCPEECPMCYTVLCPSKFTVNVKNFNMTTVCTNCDLVITIVIANDGNDSEPRRDTNQKSLKRPGPKSKTGHVVNGI